jgi:hypothetical protein
MEVSCAQWLNFGMRTECAMNIFRRGAGNCQIWRIRSLVENRRKSSRALETGVHNAWGGTTRVAALQQTNKTSTHNKHCPGKQDSPKKTPTPPMLVQHSERSASDLGFGCCSAQLEQ